MKRDFRLGLVAGLATSFVGAAMAQSEPAKTDLQIFGTAHVQFETVEAIQATAPGDNKQARQRVSNVSSDLGFKKLFDLGDGMNAQVQYASGMNTDAGTGIFGSNKDIFVGLGKTGVGTLKLGRLTGAARWSSGTADFSAAGAGAQNNQTTLTMAAGLSGSNPQFNTRIDNAVGFESDSFNGFSVRAYYGANEGKSADGVSGAYLNDGTFSVGAQYLDKGWDVRLSVEQRYDKGTLNATTNRNTTDMDYRLGVRYALTPSTTVAFGMDSMSLADSAATGALRKALSRTGWVSSLRYVNGKSTYFGSYGEANDITCELGNNTACDGSSTGGGQIVFGYQYQINKQVMLEGFFSQVKNKSRAKYDFDGGAIAPGAGATLSAIGAGIRASF